MKRNTILFALTLLLAACGGNPQKVAEQASEQLKTDNRPAFSPEYAFEVKFAEYPKGKKMAYIEAGKGDTAIVFVHGLGGYLKHWEPVVQRLQDRYRCIAVDLPGYGRSDRDYFGADDFMELYAEAVLHLAEQKGLKSFVLAGHSMGAQVAMVTALKAPDAVAALVLAAPAGFETFSTMEGMGMKSFATAEFFQQQTEEEIRQSFAANFYQLPAEAEQLIQERLAMRKNFGFEAYCNTVAEGVKGMLEHPVRPQLKEIGQPALVLFGEQDYLIPNRALHKDLTTRQIAEEGTAALGDAQLRILPEAGHLLTFEKPEAVARAIEHFLSTSSMLIQ